MNQILVWDLPTRVLHWLFAGSLSGALVIGFGFDDEHPWFAYHMLLGLVAGLVLCMRLALGIVGSRHARFSAWAWSPRELIRYVRNLLALFRGYDVSGGRVRLPLTSFEIQLGEEPRPTNHNARRHHHD